MRALTLSTVRPAAAFLLAAALGCSPDGIGKAGKAGSGDAPNRVHRLAGDWRAVLTSPGGELPFTLRLSVQGDRGDGLAAVILNGAEKAPVSAVEVQAQDLLLRFDGYDSRIRAKIAAAGDRLEGSWERTGPDGVQSMPFAAERMSGRISGVSGSLAGERFRPLPPAAVSASGSPSIAGTWAARFVDEDGTSPAEAELSQDGTRVTGTFLTPTGDYRYLEGVYEGGLLRLSTFDGAHAFLFTARDQADGSLAGDFWSRGSYHARWTAHRVAAGEAVLPDAWSQAGLTNAEGRFHFRFPDLDGRPVAADDPRFAGKVVLVNVFGSWCPNCNDEAPQLAAWYRRYHERGLEIVGLAYEMTGDTERDAQFVRRFRERHGIAYPLLLAGTSDKKAAGKTLPDLTAVVAFPTSIFLGRDGKVRKIYTGYAGPATGRHHTELIAELEKLIDTLLAEPAPGAHG